MGECSVNLLDMYETNTDFKDYVDRLAKNYNEGHSITVLEALQMAVVNDYANYLQERGK